MKKVISMFLFLIILPFEISIAEQNKLLPTEPKFILDKDMVILISPSENTIEHLKNSMGDGDDFYVMADDVNYYRSLIYDYLSDIHQPYLIKHDDTTFFYKQKNGEIRQIQNNNSNSFWWALLYNHENRKYRIVDLIDFKEEYEKFIINN